MSLSEPRSGTVQRWAWDFVLSTTLEAKLAPPPVPDATDAWEENAPVRRLVAPGRPPELRIVTKAAKTRGLNSPHGRARALHTFLHHELQAAELMAWAVLAFPDTPVEFRSGLVRIALDEIRHMHMYAKEIRRLGHEVGAFTVRDWFWDVFRAAPTRSRSSRRWVSASRAPALSTPRLSQPRFARRETRKARASRSA